MPESSKDILEQRKFTNKQVLWLVGAAISITFSVTFSGTKTYDEFELMKKSHAIEKKNSEETIKNLNRRIDTKSDRNAKRIEALEKNKNNDE